MIISLAGQKGGSGKSTIAACLADEIHSRKKSVVVLDADPQGTLVTWRHQRPDPDLGPPVVKAPSLLTDYKFAEMKKRVSGIDAEYVIIDAPPGTQAGQKAALALSDLAILPCGPAYSDVWSLQATAELARALQAKKPDFRAKIVLNRLDKRTVLSRKAEQQLRDWEMTLFDGTLSYLVDYGETLGSGRGVTVYNASGKAAREIRQLTDEVLSR